MQIEAQRLRNRAEDIEEIESGHGHRFDWAKIKYLNIQLPLIEHEFFKNTAMASLSVFVTEKEKLDLKYNNLDLN